ncbi:MAG: alanine racemase [Peptococcia bacterium]
MKKIRPVWAEINLADIVHNYQEVRRLVGPKVLVMAIVKANAYGHGAVKVAQTLSEAGANYFGVAITNEAIQLREAGIDKPILIIGWTPPEDYERALQYRIALTIYSLQEAEILSRIALEYGEKATVHLKIDTGMGRIGFIPSQESLREILQILKLPGLKVEGIFTHLAKADEKDKSYTNQQLDLFQKFCRQIEDTAGYRISLKHTANSAAIIDCPNSYFDMVRAGIMLYGLRPSAEVQLSKVDLRQALTLRARISHIKKVPPNSSISYGGIYVTEAEELIATLPIGYADGYSRLLSNRARVAWQGHTAPILGRVCMDQIMFRATGLDVKIGDVVTLIGRDRDIFLSVDEFAEILGTINYEIVCMLSERVPRVYQGG